MLEVTMSETRESERQGREAKHALEVLPGSAWRIVGNHVADYDRLAFGLTCRTLLEAVTTAASPEWKKKALPLRTDLKRRRLFKQMPCFSVGWFQWVFRSFERKKGATVQRDNECSNYLYDGDLVYLAAFQGSKKVMKWLASQGIPLDIYREDYVIVATVAAAGGGHIDVLEWLRSGGCEFDDCTCAAAARGGHLHILQWLRSHCGTPWDKWTCSWAAQGGHLEVLQWARRQDPPCPWDPNICISA
ncbi:hypothetical protein HOP50_10g60260 [Chloropicon primus]|uniref:Ankyrin repeat domain-containing protein n=1 Tax=Chloropicon primus TaxID=1764295 RepID=A0A5B8MT48_9CHLO|nr:hypothetical protein A3770_10p60050 [Chloropicon primus]UPR02699.1 hypothetical protein HOP50_10g60260 [Chloropicon primus]|eukprot:QDZ23487.1 hypothetical protein A3770_10p60050 [Chloropicon primus]